MLSHWNLTNEIFDEIVRLLLLLLLNEEFPRDHLLHKLLVVGD